MLCFCNVCYCHATLCVFNLYHFHHYYQGVLSARCGLCVILSLCLRVRSVFIAGLSFFCNALFVSDATPSDSHCCGLYSMLCHAMLRNAFDVMSCRLMLHNQVLRGVEPFVWHAVLL